MLKRLTGKLMLEDSFESLVGRHHALFTVMTPLTLIFLILVVGGFFRSQ